MTTANCADHIDYAAETCPVCAYEIRTLQRSWRQRGQRIRRITPPPAGLFDQIKKLGKD